MATCLILAPESALPSARTPETRTPTQGTSTSLQHSDCVVRGFACSVLVGRWSSSIPFSVSLKILDGETRFPGCHAQRANRLRDRGPCGGGRREPWAEPTSGWQVLSAMPELFLMSTSRKQIFSVSPTMASSNARSRFQEPARARDKLRAITGGDCRKRKPGPSKVEWFLPPRGFRACLPGQTGMTIKRPSLLSRLRGGNCREDVHPETDRVSSPTRGGDR
jgi:hypothetical protein